MNLKQASCDPVEDKRCLQKTWTSVEVQIALEHGYKIIEIYEIYNLKRKGNIVKDYVNICLKIKQESSGIPPDCLHSDGTVKGVLCLKGRIWLEILDCTR